MTSYEYVGNPYALGAMLELELGNYAKYVSSDNKTARRLALQTYAQCLIEADSSSYDKTPRVTQCNRVPAAQFNSDDSSVQLVVSENSDGSRSASYGNLLRCGSVWHCPYCAPRIAEERRARLKAGLQNAYDAHKGVYMGTFTFSHQFEDDLQSLKNAISASFRALLSGSTWQKFQAMFGIEAYIRDSEVTYGGNGFHPHFHAIFVTERVLDDEQVLTYQDGDKFLFMTERGYFEHKLKSMWVDRVSKNGISCDYSHGCQVDDDYSRIADYITKFGELPTEVLEGAKKAPKGAHESFSYELTYQDTKTSYSTSSMWSVLEHYALGSDHENYTSAQAGKAFQEYARVYHGTKMLVASKGNKKTGRVGFWELLGVEDFEDDDLLLEDDADLLELLRVSIPLFWWWLVVRSNARVELLEVARNTVSETAIFEYLASLVPRSPPQRILTYEQIVLIALWHRWKARYTSVRELLADNLYGEYNYVLAKAAMLEKAQNITNLDLSKEYKKAFDGLGLDDFDDLLIVDDCEVMNKFIQPILF